MMQHEFEELAGYEVSTEDYNNIIEPMYMAVNLSKAEFVKTVNKKRFALKPVKNIVKEMKAVAKHLQETCEMYTDWEAKEKLEALVKEYIERKGWKGIAGHNYDHGFTGIGYRGCAYPKRVEIYGLKKYNTFEKIELV